jgi:hypothetical protein
MYNVNHGWLYGNVKPYFAKQGITLLKDDMLFIERCLGNIPTDRHRIVMRDYLAIWNATIQQKENASNTRINGRYEANVYLRQASGLVNEVN